MGSVNSPNAVRELQKIMSHGKVTAVQSYHEGFSRTYNITVVITDEQMRYAFPLVDTAKQERIDAALAATGTTPMPMPPKVPCKPTKKVRRR